MRITTSFQSLFPRLGLTAALALTTVAVQAQTPTPTWASVRRATSSGPITSNGSNAQKILVAADGSQIIYGIYEGTITFAGTTLTAGTGDAHLFLAKLNADGSMAWVRQIEGTEEEYAASLAVDAAGNVYMAGYFTGSFSFGAVTLTTSNRDVVDAFIVKFDAQGQPLWSKTGGATTDNVYLDGIGTDAAGNVYVAGDFTGTVDFGGSSANQLTAASEDIFLYKFSAAGVPLWTRQAGGTNGDYNYGLAVDATGNAYLTGSISGSATFGSITLASTTTDEDLYVVKYDAQGTALWAQREATANEDQGLDIAVDAAGQVVVGGYANGRQVGTSYESAGYLARFSAPGPLLWSRQITASTPSEYGIGSVAYDGRGGIYAVSSYDGTLTLGPSTLTTNEETSFVARFDGQGTPLWADAATHPTSNDASIFFDVTTDASGNAYIVGGVLGNVSFGSIATTGSGADAFIAKLNAGGVVTANRAPAALALAAYPNPASEHTTLVLPVGGGQLTLLDALGRQVRRQALPASAGSYSVSVAGLTPGMYHLHATLGNGQVAITRLEVR
ncbi:SBBP repeat-containing protein [Hymenobacter swuensis]|uniref:Secretion system C-terminal sorting domain-containing protein n=1 Tax=Hymenobacter swuensis DY53 TaxID=1227739 RepID=W8FAQ7_9BACT|nr:SBBP repeat-containing protein [Hymenobacter swuensis]AHJ98790.1 hypothetical protein Hsw_3195 [Hymenobacter swuensis DY53]